MAGDVAHRDVPTCTLADNLQEVRERVRAAGWDTCIVVNEQRVVLGRLGRTAIAADTDEPVERAMTPGPSTSGRASAPTRCWSGSVSATSAATWSPPPTDASSGLSYTAISNRRRAASGSSLARACTPKTPCAARLRPGRPTRGALRSRSPRFFDERGEGDVTTRPAD